MKYSKDGLVCFNPKDHSYLKGDRKLEGVTSFISRHKNPFDMDKIAEAYANKRGLVKENVIESWKEKGRISREVGTMVHDFIENWFNTKFKIDAPFGKQAVAAKFIKDYFLTGRLIPVDCETIIYDNEKASMIDMVVRNKLGEHFILDWKTNEEIKYNAYGKWMLRPFHILPDVDYYHYSLQVRLYEKMCKEYDIKDSFIVHIGHANYELIKPYKISV